MTASVKRVGASGQISLGKEFAGRTVLIESTEPGVWLIKTARTIPLQQDEPGRCSKPCAGCRRWTGSCLCSARDGAGN